MLTELGKELRKLRIDRDEKLLDMANKLGLTSTFVSAVENGRKSPPSGFEEAIVRAYHLAIDAADKLRSAADRSRRAFTIEPATTLGRDTAGLMARRMNTLSTADLEAIHRILSKGEPPDDK